MNSRGSATLVDVFVLRSLAPAEADDQESQSSQQLESCLVLYGILPQHTYLAADGRRMLCHFRAPDAESLRMVLRGARIEYDAVWTAEVKDTPDEADSTDNYTLATTLLRESDAELTTHDVEKIQ